VGIRTNSRQPHSCQRLHQATALDHRCRASTNAKKHVFPSMAEQSVRKIASLQLCKCDSQASFFNIKISVSRILFCLLNTDCIALSTAQISAMPYDSSHVHFLPSVRFKLLIFQFSPELVIPHGRFFWQGVRRQSFLLKLSGTGRWICLSGQRLCFHWLILL
jgi:hypothetical protein